MFVQDVVVVGYTVGEDKGERVGCIIVPNLDAIIAANGGTEPTWGDIERLVKNRVISRCATLADYKHPRKIVVRRDPLDRTSIQKVRRVAYQGSLNE